MNQYIQSLKDLAVLLQLSAVKAFKVLSTFLSTKNFSQALLLSYSQTFYDLVYRGNTFLTDAV